MEIFCLLFLQKDPISKYLKGEDRPKHMTWDNILQFFNDWQLLLGAATPLSIWFITDFINKKRGRKENLYSLEKDTLYCINKLLGLRNAISDFSNKGLNDLLRNIQLRNQQNKYSIDTAFFPLLNVQMQKENAIKLSTGSGYLDTKLLQTHLMAGDIERVIEDLRWQFIDTIKVNREIAIKKLNSQAVQTNDYHRNLTNFKNMLETDFIETNVNTYMRTLTKALAGVETYAKLGRFRWRLIFEPSFKYYKNYPSLQKYKREIHDYIDNYLEKIVDKKITEIQRQYT